MRMAGCIYAVTYRQSIHGIWCNGHEYVSSSNSGSASNGLPRTKNKAEILRVLVLPRQRRQATDITVFSFIVDPGRCMFLVRNLFGAECIPYAACRLNNLYMLIRAIIDATTQPHDSRNIHVHPTAITCVVINQTMVRMSVNIANNVNARSTWSIVTCHSSR